MTEKTSKALAVVVIGVFTCAVLAVILFGLWQGWTLSLSYFWPEGPERVIRPDFIPFSAAWLMTVFGLRSLRGLLK